MMTPPRFYARTFGLLTAAGLGFLLWKTLSPFSSALLWAALLAYMLMPLHRALLRRWKRPALAAGLVTALTTVVIAGPVTVFLFMLVRQATELLSRLQAEAVERQLPALQLVLELGPVARLVDWVGGLTSLSKEQLLAAATGATRTAVQGLATLSGSVVVVAFSTVLQFLLAMFLLFFFLRDGGEMVALGVRLIPMKVTRKEELTLHLGSVTKAVVRGTLITASVQGTLLGIGFSIAGLPSPLVFGVLGALAALVPVVGTTLVWVPAVVTLLAQGHTGSAIFLAVWSVVLVGGSDNVLRPLLISGAANVSPLLVFIGVLGGVGTFGAAGLFMGPLLLTLVAGLLRFADESSVGHAIGSSDSQPPTAPPSAPAAPATPASAAKPPAPASSAPPG